ncbi:MAG: hypothetical protein QXF48_01595 [Candidatus Anstonellaceae archaeon]
MKYASYLYPIEEEKKNYKLFINSITNEELKQILIAISITGFRINEILNCYFFYSEDKLICRAPSSKSLISTSSFLSTKSKNARFLGRRILTKLLDKNIWKSVYCTNLFNLNIEYIKKSAAKNTLDKVNEFFCEPFRKCKTYDYIYRKLKHEQLTIKTKFKATKEEVPAVVFSTPAFHFFRKLYASEFYSKTKDVFKTIDQMRWKKLDTSLFYIKNYKEVEYE